MSAPPVPWDDDTADLVALVGEARRDMTPACQEAMQALFRHCDRDGVLAVALKVLAELAGDLGMPQEYFADYAGRAVARGSAR